MKVHSRSWSCSLSGNPAFCTCAVVAKHGSDVIEMSMCGGVFSRTALEISMKSSSPLTNGTHITEAADGKRFTVKGLGRVCGQQLGNYLV